MLRRAPLALPRHQAQERRVGEKIHRSLSLELLGRVCRSSWVVGPGVELNPGSGRWERLVLRCLFLSLLAGHVGCGEMHVIGTG